MAEKKEAKRKPSVAKALPEGMFGTKEAAERLKIEPRKLRIWLRAQHGSNKGERYAWDEKGLVKLAAEYKASTTADEKK
jgi:hypothetical protein